MKLSENERAAHRDAFRQMNLPGKMEYIYTYFKWPILLSIIAVVILCSAAHRFMTQKDVVLYAAYVNVSVGTDLESRLTDGYLGEERLDPQKHEIFFYRDLYLSENPAAEDHEFAYASRMKLMATAADEELDLVLMNREAYDILSRSGYLMVLDGLLPEALEPYLTTNAVVLDDNAIDYNLGNAEEYWEVTEDVINAIDVTTLPLFQQAGFPDTVYLGIIGNTPRLEVCVKYCEYLASAAMAE